MSPFTPCTTCGKTAETCSFCDGLARHMLDANVHTADAAGGPYSFRLMALDVLEPASLKEIHGYVLVNGAGEGVANCDTEDEVKRLVEALNGGRRANATVYLCDQHREELLSEEAQNSELDIEVGAYCPTNDCPECDTWV
jgi:hypothetical protein